MKSQGTGVRGQGSDRGFTLVEVMIAMVVLLIGMLGVMSMQYYAVSGNQSSREMRIATNLNYQLIEQMKATPYANLATNTSPPNPAGDATMLGGVTFSQSWWVVPDCVELSLAGNALTCTALLATCTTDPDATSAVASSAVRVRTCWTDKYGGNHSVTFDSVRWDENVTP